MINQFANIKKLFLLGIAVASTEVMFLLFGSLYSDFGVIGVNIN